MAIADVNEDQADQNNNSNNTTADPINQPGDEASGDDSGPRNGRQPIPASDFFAAEVPENMNLSNLSVQTVIASLGERVTSVSGTPGIDIISRLTVMQQLFSLTVVPQRDKPSQRNSTGDTLPNYSVSSSPAEAQGNSLVDTGGHNSDASITEPLSSAPSLSMDSIRHDESLSLPTLEPTLVSPQESVVQSEAEAPCGSSEQSSAVNVNDPTRCPKDTQMEAQHLGENGEISEHQLDSSGYKTDSTDAETNAGSEHGSAQSEACWKNTVNTVTDNGFSLPLSEAAINKIKCMSGRQREPVKPRYSSLSIRRSSFPKDFRLGGDAQVNRDLLALAGFYYSDHNTATCFHCGCSPRVWGDGRDPDTEHRMLSPYCRALPSL